VGLVACRCPHVLASRVGVASIECAPMHDCNDDVLQTYMHACAHSASSCSDLLKRRKHCQVTLPQPGCDLIDLATAAGLWNDVTGSLSLRARGRSSLPCMMTARLTRSNRLLVCLRLKVHSRSGQRVRIRRHVQRDGESDLLRLSHVPCQLSVISLMTVRNCGPACMHACMACVT
jgi:hypothetical protein